MAAFARAMTDRLRCSGARTGIEKATQRLGAIDTTVRHNRFATRLPLWSHPPVAPSYVVREGPTLPQGLVGF